MLRGLNCRLLGVGPISCGSRDGTIGKGEKTWRGEEIFREKKGEETFFEENHWERLREFFLFFKKAILEGQNTIYVG